MWVTNTPSGKMLCPQNTSKLLVLIFLQKHNMLTHWSVEDLSRFFCLLCNCVSLSYDKLLFHEQCTSSCNIVDGFLWQYTHTALFFNLLCRNRNIKLDITRSVIVSCRSFLNLYEMILSG